jgi:hypothetical protein
MIQDFFNTTNEKSAGGLQLVVAAGGGVQHWRRGPDDTNAWELVETTGSGIKHVWALVQGSFGGRMHMVTEGTDGRFSYWEWDGSWREIGDVEVPGR